MDVAVLVPVYAENPSPKELKCFLNNCKVLSNRPIFLVAPESLNVMAYNYAGVKTECFKPEFFKGIAGYNRLMLSEEFYDRFKDYKYILICQLDVFVFKDDLDYWVKSDFDFVGAPWIDRFFNVLTYVAVKTNIFKALKLLFSTRKINNCVGNGGFSLRKTNTFLQSLREHKAEVEKWPANEDFYYSFFAKVNGKALKVPDYKNATRFSIELKPKKLRNIIAPELPMGIHAWERYDKNFWKATLKQHGYEFE